MAGGHFFKTFFQQDFQTCLVCCWLYLHCSLSLVLPRKPRFFEFAKGETNGLTNKRAVIQIAKRPRQQRFPPLKPRWQSRLTPPYVPRRFRSRMPRRFRSRLHSRFRPRLPRLFRSRLTRLTRLKAVFTAALSQATIRFRLQELEAWSRM